MLTDTPLVSIITLNYNHTSVTCDFLESTRGLRYPNYEIIVCDMASATDPTEEILRGRYPKTRVVRSRVNLGFAGGNNLGMREACGEYIFIVNNDTIVTPDILNRLLEPFVTDTSISVVCPKIRFYDRPEFIQYAGFYPIHPITGRTAAIGNKELDRGQYNVSGYTHGAHGCAMMVRKEAIDKTGMFPERFFLYYEEWDWSYRMLRAGYKIYYQASAVIYHKESMTIGKQNPMKVYYQTRNRILFMRRNVRPLQFSLFVVFFTFFTIPASSLRFIFHKQYAQLTSFFKGIAWNFMNSKHSITH